MQHRSDAFLSLRIYAGSLRLHVHADTTSFHQHRMLPLLWTLMHAAAEVLKCLPATGSRMLWAQRQQIRGHAGRTRGQEADGYRERPLFLVEGVKVQRSRISLHTTHVYLIVFAIVCISLTSARVSHPFSCLPLQYTAA